MAKKSSTTQTLTEAEIGARDQVRKRVTDKEINERGYDQAGYREGQAASKKADDDQQLADEKGEGFNEVTNPYDPASNIGISWQAGFDDGGEPDPTAGRNLGPDSGPQGSNVVGTDSANVPTRVDRD